MTIAFLRYYLLVTSKKEQENETIDMFRLRRLALLFNWLLICFILIVRGVLRLPVLTNDAININVRLGIDIGMLFIIGSITIIMYYKMDIDLKSFRAAEKEDENHRKNSVRNSSCGAARIINAWDNHKDTQTKQSFQSYAITHPSDDSISPNIQSRLSRKRRNAMQAHCQPNIDSNKISSQSSKIERSDYGGIYIGKESRYKTKITL